MYVKTQIRPFPSTASSSRDATSMISVKFAISGCYVAATLRLSLECLQLLLLALLPASSCLWLLLATTSGDYVAVAVMLRWLFANEASGHSQGAPRQSQGEKKATEGLAQ